MAPPDPWFERILSDKKRFVPAPCQFVELWQDADGSDDVASHTGTLQPSEVENWVKEKDGYRTRPQNSASGLRLLVAPAPLQTWDNMQWPFSQDTCNMIIDEFNLLTTVFHACWTGNRLLVCCKSRLASKGLVSWVLRQLSHAATLTHHLPTRTTYALVLTDPTSTLSASVPSLAATALALRAHASHPTLLPLIVLKQDADRLAILRERDNHATLRLERKIGLRRDWTTDEAFLRGTDGAMRLALEHLTMVTNHKVDAEVLGGNLAGWEGGGFGGAGAGGRREEKGAELEYLVEYLRRSNESVAASFGALQKRVEVQISGLYTLLGQRDSKLNLAMARDSRRLASASKRDSSSMKTIAVLTTVFLPGTFIATVFSMPMVDYAPSQFWIYLAISIPLTAVVLAIWGAWMTWVNAHNERQDARAVREGGVSSSLGGSLRDDGENYGDGEDDGRDLGRGRETDQEKNVLLDGDGERSAALWRRARRVLGH